MDAAHLVEPGGGFLVAVGFYGVKGEFPVLFFEFYEALGEANDVLGDDIVVLHAVEHEEVAL